MIPVPLPFLWLALLPAPQATPSFPTEVEVITVDAVVVDKDGRPVTGLTRDEFRVLEDSKPQEIVSFEPYERSEPGGEDEVEPPAIATNERGTELRGRAFALLLDDVFTPIQGSAEVRQAVESFLRNSVGPGDEVTIATTSGNAYWSAGLPEGLEDLLAVAARFKGRDAGGRYGTQEYAQMHQSPEEMRFGQLELKRMTELQAYGIVSGGASGDQPIAHEINHIRIQRMKITLAAVRRQLDALATVRGRKSLILMSPGFLQDDTPDIRETAAASRRRPVGVRVVESGRLAVGVVASAGVRATDEAPISGPGPSSGDAWASCAALERATTGRDGRLAESGLPTYGAWGEPARSSRKAGVCSPSGPGTVARAAAPRRWTVA
jgi:VWFA-related protein